MIISIDEIGGVVERAQKLLAGVPGGTEKALKSAMTRSVAYLRTRSGQRIRERYAISQKDIRANENIKVKYSFGNGVQATVNFSGFKIPLYRYSGTSPKGPAWDTGSLVRIKIKEKWITGHKGITAAGHQLVSTSPVRIPNTFVATFDSGHTGIFERTGGVTSNGLDRIEEIMGSSVAQMVGHEKVAEPLVEDAAKKFEERAEHEIPRIMNGW